MFIFHSGDFKTVLNSLQNILKRCINTTSGYFAYSTTAPADDAKIGIGSFA
jgi:hypothetical protein